MLILDSNHLRVLSIASAQGDKLKAKILTDGREPVTTIINVYEGIRGYLAEIHKSHEQNVDSMQKVRAYGDLNKLLEYYSEITILAFDEAAAKQYDVLKKKPNLRKVQARDLQIAAIALCYQATLLTQNLKDFKDIPGLNVADWLLDEPSDEPPF